MPSSLATSGIAAEAFRLIELQPGSSLADGGEKSQAAEEQYPLALQECLETAEWSFASVLAKLPAGVLPGTSAADLDLPYFYSLPGDCIRILSVGDSWTAWRLDAVGLRADDPAPLTIRYTAMMTNEAKMSASFRLFVSLALAIRLSPLYQTSEGKLQQLRDMHKEQRALAMRQDARTASQARTDDLEQQDDWVTEATI